MTSIPGDAFFLVFRLVDDGDDEKAGKSLRVSTSQTFRSREYNVDSKSNKFESVEASRKQESTLLEIQVLTARLVAVGKVSNGQKPLLWKSSMAAVAGIGINLGIANVLGPKDRTKGHKNA